MVFGFAFPDLLVSSNIVWFGFSVSSWFLPGPSNVLWLAASMAWRFFHRQEGRLDLDFFSRHAASAAIKATRQSSRVESRVTTRAPGDVGKTWGRGENFRFFSFPRKRAVWIGPQDALSFFWARGELTVASSWAISVAISVA